MPLTSKAPMNMRLLSRSFSMLLLLFLIITLLSCWASYRIGKDTFDLRLVFGANLIYFLLSAFSLRLQERAVVHPNPHVFVRTIVGGMFLKMMFTALALFVYVRWVNPHYGWVSVFSALLVYLCYLVAGVYFAGKLNRKNI